MAQTYEPTDRRPLASRELKIWQRFTTVLAARNVSPNLISILGMIAGIAAGIALYATSRVDGWQQRILELAGAAGIQLRLLANMLDGMVAIARQRASPLGELYNELPDRVSDIAIIVGAGYAAGGSPTLGYWAACIAVVTAYVRAVGKAAGVSSLFLGPMAKPHRMFTLTVVCLLMFGLPSRWQPDWTDRHLGLFSVALAIIIVGGCITTFRRVAAIVRHLQKPA